MSIDIRELERLDAEKTSKRLLHEEGTSFIHSNPSTGDWDMPCASIGDAALVAYLFNHVPEILAAIRDKERLDKLERVAYTAYRNRDAETSQLYGHHTLVNEDRKPRVGIVENTLRAAIDALEEE